MIFLNYSIGIYKDKRENLLIIPDGFDENGIRRAMNKFRIIEIPYDMKTVGEIVIKVFDEVVKNPHQDAKSAVKVFEIATGIKSYSKFSKDRLLVAGSFEADKGYIFSPWKRYPDGSYGLDKGEEIEFKANIKASAEEIGELVAKAFEATNQLK